MSIQISISAIPHTTCDMKTVSFDYYSYGPAKIPEIPKNITTA